MCSTILITKAKKMKITLRYVPPVRMANSKKMKTDIGKNVEKSEFWYAVDRRVD
jgi:hypothetical protein